ncbi:polysaccharide deacetylase family protein [Alkalicoccobacillus porphyridii]|uniref:Polysaccharide deacetylase family protein n=1 Tax=Alkalicoccobacillus porphyridii TaxID=2597270 RepID=A0A553ZTW6_9BACI|nr:polysaccharide deacetylase family protein [Alkalicoccobacillus porphyridii]TSB44910.1 polysaccharide deacetylase family protein [Alkalicoccobacillus porphyridii]
MIKKVVVVFVCICISFLFSIKGFAKDRFDYEQTGKAIWDIPTTKPLIALTFDDGPHPIYTKKIMDLLDRYDAKATFFVTGSQVEKLPEVIQQLANNGHEIGNHTYHHFYSHTMSKQILRAEIKETEKKIVEITGVYPHLFRPVGGYYDDMIIETAAEENYQVVMWSWHQDSKDWANPGVGHIIRNVLPKAQSGDIILFHDAGGKRTQTVQALEVIIPALLNEGYELVTVSDLIKMTNHWTLFKQL